MMKREKSCGAVVIDGDRVLIIKQTAGHTAFPKGHVEPGESEVETAKREIFEETGIEVEIDPSFRMVETFSPKSGVLKDVVYFLARPIGGSTRVQEEEVESIQWLGFDEARRAITYAGARRILDAAIAHINR